MASMTQDLHCNRSLSGNHIGIIVRVDENSALALLQFERARIGIAVGIAVQDNGRAKGLHRGDLDRRGSYRHDDGRPARQALSGQRDSLRVVARRCGDHTALALCRG